MIERGDVTCALDGTSSKREEKAADDREGYQRAAQKTQRKEQTKDRARQEREARKEYRIGILVVWRGRRKVNGEKKMTGASLSGLNLRAHYPIRCPSYTGLRKLEALFAVLILTMSISFGYMVGTGGWAYVVFKRVESTRG